MPPAVLVCLLLAAAALVAHSLVFNFVTDDAFISFRYARNLALHGELTFNPGERVEGYTNFLWTVLLAGLMRLGAAPELSSRVLGTGLALASMLLLVRLSWRVHGRLTGWACLAPLMLAQSPGFACWASGGLETQLFTFLVLWGLVGRIGEELEGGPPRWSALPLGLAALTRPEGVLVFGLVALHRLIARRSRGVSSGRPPLWHELPWVGLFLAVVLPHLAWRWWYYGYPLPNTFYVKTSSTSAAQGFYYVGRAATDLALWLLVPLAALGAWTARPGGAVRGAAALQAVVAAGLLAFVVAVGGDFMGLYRFVVPLLPLCAWLAQEGLLAGWAAVRSRSGSKAAGAVVMGVLVALGGWGGWITHRSLRQGADRGIDRPGFLRQFARDRAIIGRWMARHARPDDLMTVGGVGAQPYYAGIRAIDVFGLVDAHVAHRVAATSSRPGHQKSAPDEYLLSRRPTLLCHSYRLGAHPPERTIEEQQRWRQRGYHWVVARIEGLSSGRYYGFWKRLDRSFGPFPADLSP